MLVDQELAYERKTKADDAALLHAALQRGALYDADAARLLSSPFFLSVGCDAAKPEEARESLLKHNREQRKKRTEALTDEEREEAGRKAKENKRKQKEEVDKREKNMCCCRWCSSVELCLVEMSRPIPSRSR